MALLCRTHFSLPVRANVRLQNIMRNVIAILIAAVIAVACTSESAQAPLYTVSSKAQGAPFDLVVNEIKRENTKSSLSVPGFHNRTAPGARWLMCVYTDLAIKREFRYWTVMYPVEGNEVLVVGFSNSPTTSPKEVLGSEFDKERVIGEDMMPVEKFVAFCGIRR